MLYFVCDNTFEGLLTAVFDAFNRKEYPDCIVGKDDAIPLFAETFTVVTDIEKANRVLVGLKKKISKSALNMLFVCFLAESNETSMNIFHYIRKAFASDISIELNFADDDVLALSKIYRKVTREAERMRQFVRFQKTADGIFFAVMEPLYNVLPMNVKFFADRYADQRWIVYDVRRNYGVYYDLHKTEIVQFDRQEAVRLNGKLSAEQSDEAETAFQNLWKDYLQAITIRERKNLRLQRQFMPKRFWKYLIEKK